MSREYRELLDKELDTVSGGTVIIGEEKISDAVNSEQKLTQDLKQTESMLDVATKSEQRRIETVGRFTQPTVKNQFPVGKDAATTPSTWNRIVFALRSFLSKK